MKKHVNPLAKRLEVWDVPYYANRVSHSVNTSKTELNVTVLCMYLGLNDIDTALKKSLLCHFQAKRGWFSVDTAKISEYFSLGVCMEGLNTIFKSLYSVELRIETPVEGGRDKFVSLMNLFLFIYLFRGRSGAPTSTRSPCATSPRPAGAGRPSGTSTATSSADPESHIRCARILYRVWDCQRLFKHSKRSLGKFLVLLSESWYSAPWLL